MMSEDKKSPWSEPTKQGSLNGSYTGKIDNSVTIGSGYMWPNINIGSGSPWTTSTSGYTNEYAFPWFRNEDVEAINNEILDTLHTISKYGVPNPHSGWDKKSRDSLLSEIKDVASEIIERINKDLVKANLKAQVEDQVKYNLQYPKQFAILNNKIKLYRNGIDEKTLSR